jgi:hypothetical protein
MARRRTKRPAQRRPREAPYCLAPAPGNDDDIVMDRAAIAEGNQNAFFTPALLAWPGRQERDEPCDFKAAG